MIMITVVQWRRDGGMRPRRHCAGAAFGGAKIWNCEIWPVLANWRLRCRQRVIFYTP